MKKIKFFKTIALTSILSTTVLVAACNDNKTNTPNLFDQSLTYTGNFLWSTFGAYTFNQTALKTTTGKNFTDFLKNDPSVIGTIISNVSHKINQDINTATQGLTFASWTGGAAYNTDANKTIIKNSIKNEIYSNLFLSAMEVAFYNNDYYVTNKAIKDINGNLTNIEPENSAFEAILSMMKNNTSFNLTSGTTTEDITFSSKMEMPFYKFNKSLFANKTLDKSVFSQELKSKFLPGTFNLTTTIPDPSGATTALALNLDINKLQFTINANIANASNVLSISGVDFNSILSSS